MTGAETDLDLATMNALLCKLSLKQPDFGQVYEKVYKRKAWRLPRLDDSSHSHITNEIKDRIAKRSNLPICHY